jgi:hypothetical protein
MTVIRFFVKEDKPPEANPQPFTERVQGEPMKKRPVFCWIGEIRRGKKTFPMKRDQENLG